MSTQNEKPNIGIAGGVRPPRARAVALQLVTPVGRNPQSKGRRP
jgi:hypothetical protein